MRSARARGWLLAAVVLVARPAVVASDDRDPALEAALAGADPHAALQELSQRYFDAGDWEKGAAVDGSILERAKGALGPQHPDVIAARQNLGLDLYRLGRFREGERLLDENRSALERTSGADPAVLADTLGMLAEFLRAENRYADAEALFQRALALGPSDPATLLTNLAGLYRDTNRYAEALWRTSQALTLIEATPGVSGADLAGAWNNMAEIYRFQGDLRAAESYYQKAVDMARKALGPEHTRLATFLNQLAEVCREAGRSEEAERLFREALAMRIHLLGPHHLDVASTYEGLGLLLARSGRRAEAESALREARAIRSGQLGGEHPEVATTLIELADLLGGAPERRKEARQLLDAALDALARTPAGGRIRADAYARRAADRDRDGDRVGALGDLSQALAIVERLRPEAGGGEQTRARFASSHADDYARMVGWLLDGHAISEAFRYAERGRARALLDQLEASHVALGSGLPASERATFAAKEAAVLADLAEARARLASAEGSLSAHDPGIRAALDAVAAQETAFARLYEDAKNASRIWRETDAGSAARSLRIEDVQAQVLRKNELLVTYVLGSERSFALVVPASGRPAAIPLAIPEAVASRLGVPAGPLTRPLLRRMLAPETLDPAAPDGILVQLSVPPLRDRPRMALAGSLHALWQVLVPPALWSQIETCDEVVLLPDDLLYRLPFEALVVGDTESGPRYWLDAGPVIRYGASVLTLLRLSQRESGRKADLTLASVADPTFEPTGSTPALAAGLALTPLPGTAKEAARIRAAFPAPRETLLLQKSEATESAVRSALPRARYIHLATHGLVDETRGELFASLALAPGPPGTTLDDGLLQLYEIYDLPLDAELAVISSCESRVGQIVAGEGVFALSRAFLAAGARRVVASLWRAEDEATAELMASFFMGVAQGEGGRAPAYARALADAKKVVRSRVESADPFFWATFVLEGPE